MRSNTDLAWTTLVKGEVNASSDLVERVSTAGATPGGKVSLCQLNIQFGCMREYIKTLSLRLILFYILICNCII